MSLRTRAITISFLASAASVGATPGDTKMIVPHPTPSDGIAAPVLFINRCTGGCPVTGSPADDASANTSSVPCVGTLTCGVGGCMCSQVGGTWTVSEFQNNAGMAGSAADAEWNQIMQCVREVYSPYAVTVTDVRPTGGVSFTEGILAGIPEDIGLSSQQTGGVAPARYSNDCGPKSNVISFSFANLSFYRGPGRVFVLCGVVAQETAHAFGLDHEYTFTDMTSACRSPMSYRQDCGGEKFFRGIPANCGEYANRPCQCGGLQASHKKLLSVLGPGTPITAPPHLTVTQPAPGATIPNGQSVLVSAGAQRGVARVELWLNNHRWAQASGAAWQQQGQPDPSSYVLVFPATVPDGVIDLDVKAFDDIESETDAPTITVTKGAPCTSAATCLAGQKCETGKCFWDPPTGELGDACTFNEFCVSGICNGPADKPLCTQDCVVGSLDACPMGYDCLPTSETGGICYPAGATGGCPCNAGPTSTGALVAHGGLAAMILSLLVRRRKRCELSDSRSRS
jgi:hypothetical protein